MSEPQVKKPLNLGQFIVERFSEILGVILFVGWLVFLYCRKVLQVF